MASCIIVHGCPDSEEKAMSDGERTYDKHWIPWIKRKLEQKGVKTKVPLMPEPWEAIYEDWKEVIDGLDIDENSILVGHSCGCAFLVRWLGDSRKKVNKLILVAPWKILYGDYLKREDKVNFYKFEINEEVRDNVNDVVIFTSDNEEEEGRKSAKLFAGALVGKVIEIKGRGHYSLGDMGTEEFPELLEEILR
jgi:uncharacterized protein